MKSTTSSCPSRDSVTVSVITVFKGLSLIVMEVVVVCSEGGEERRMFCKGDTKCVSLNFRNQSINQGVPGGSFPQSKPVVGAIVEPVTARFRINLG